MGILEGKVALITGAGSPRGQGAVAARLFAAEGAIVVMTDLPNSEGALIAAEIGESASYTDLDVTDGAAWARVVAAMVERYGGIDLLVNNAGVWLDKSLADTSQSEWNAVVDVNQNSVYLGMRAVIASMRARGGGAIVNTCSNAAFKGGGMPFAYAASKWAVRGMTRAAAAELTGEGIRVNAVCPGVIDTQMLEGDEENKRRLAEMVPIGRLGRPEEVARTVLFLASDYASFISGAEVAVDSAITA